MILPSMFKQMALRTSAMFIVKLLGLLLRIPLFRYLGPEGVGLYQIAYSFYGLVLTLLTGGMPMAVTLSTAKNAGNGWRIYRNMSVLYIGVCTLLCTGFFLFTNEIALLLGNEKLELAIRMFLPALWLVPLLSLLRGFLQGVEAFGAIAASELVEQSVRVGTILLLLSSVSMPQALGTAALGASTGAVCALAFLLVMLLRHSLSSSASATSSEALPERNLRLFAHTALALTATRLIIPLSDFLEAAIVPMQLQASGLPSGQALAIFGEMTGMAMTIVYIPTLITFSLTHTLSPKIAADWQARQFDRAFRRIGKALNLSMLWGISASLFLFTFAEELARLLFDQEKLATAIRLLSLCPLLAGLRELTTSVLWAVGQKKEPMRGILIGIVCSMTVLYVLTGIPGWGYTGIAAGVLLFETIPVLWNLTVLRRDLQLSFSGRTLVMNAVVLLLLTSVVTLWGGRLLPAAGFTGMPLQLTLMLLTFACSASYVALVALTRPK
ncbi:oligosaccharide flippase family protein [Paenibacillus sp. MZ04-78.2]|uniref:oligosaccharide flippase family protein n=1 Tax=Paenibacillus sp. MZ04-78.2 TaxID=2962034 RepID=UPI0020B8ECD8|nr:oligosaccharide flippase family protein [Paenibacillus sp. MZ04-78.2]MCP3774322.1 oligosaccharide flippase family protein [Paenibacillus sp. MZ04-78.2]